MAKRSGKNGATQPKPKPKKGGRKSKAESMTGAAANAVEMRTSEGLNLPPPVELSADDFNLHLKALRAAKDKMDTAKRLYDGCCKAAKKVSPEMLAAVKLGVKLEGLDREDVKSELSIYGFVLKTTEHSIQLILHDSLLGDVKGAAFNQGHTDAKAGRASKSPFPENSDLDKEYRRGHDLGTAQNFGLSTDEADEALAGERSPAELEASQIVGNA